MKHLILGGARSGKSRYAEQLALANHKRLVYIATAEAADEEMAARIAQHQAQRSEHWHLVEEPLDLALRLSEFDDADTAILVDCLTLWLSNCLHHGVFERKRRELLERLPTLQSDLYLVSNEVGSGVVPLGQLSRMFVDNSGHLHQALATHCERVSLVVAGLPLELKRPD